MVDNKPKGKKTAYNCFIQVIREEHKKNHPDEVVGMGEFSKKCAEKWNKMKEEEKQRFKDMADEDRVRYEKEMKTYVPPEGTKKRKAAKDPNKPKRAPTAFFVFSAELRPSVKAENPDWKVTDIAKELGKRWNALTDKSKYEKLAKEGAEKREEEVRLADSESKAKQMKSNGDVEDDEEDDE